MVKVKCCSHVGCANLAIDGVACHRHGVNEKKNAAKRDAPMEPFRAEYVSLMARR